MTPQEETKLSAELLATGVEVEADEDELAADLHELLTKDADEAPDLVLVKLLRILVNAANGAADVHVEMDDGGPALDRRLRAAAAHLENAADLLDAAARA